jgi:hypothetical protein
MVFFTGGFKFSNGFVAQRSGAPLALVFGKKGKCGRADFGCADGGIGYTAGSADMRSNIFHKKLQLSRWGEGNDSGLAGELHHP